jgi:glucoamylase
MSEVYYPTLDTPNTQSLRFIFCTDQTCIDEANDMKHASRVLDSRSLTFQQINRMPMLGAQASPPANYDSQTQDRGGQLAGEDACVPSTKHQVCITKTYTTDIERPTVLIDVRIQSSNAPNSALYLYYDPSLSNSGMHDTAWGSNGSLLSSDGNVSSALISSTALKR